MERFFFLEPAALPCGLGGDMKATEMAVVLVPMLVRFLKEEQARLLQAEARSFLQMDEQSGGDAKTIVEMKIRAGNLEVGLIDPKRAGEMAGGSSVKTACTVAARITQGHHAKQMLNGADVHAEFVPESVVLCSLHQGADTRLFLVEILAAQRQPVFWDQAADRMAMNEELFFFPCLGLFDMALRVELVLGDVGGVGAVSARGGTTPQSAEI